MKYSKFNIEKYLNDGGMLLYNTFSSGILYLDAEGLSAYIENKKTGTSLPTELFNHLKEGQMILEDNCIDEIDEMKLKSRINQFSLENLALTIAPTTNCNFACPYCYEQDREYLDMDEDVEMEIIKFIESLITPKTSLYVTWYGGEPLLRMDTIKRLSNKFKDLLNSQKISSYAADMVTNGYLLSEKNAKQLSDMNITHVQVTIDGCEETHNKRRVLRNGKGTYKKIIENINDAIKHINVSIRVNVDPSNDSNINSLFNDLDTNGLKDKVTVYIAPVENIHNTCSTVSCYSIANFSEIELDFLRIAQERGYAKVQMPEYRFTYCGAVLNSSYVIDPHGNLYKCWNDIGRKEYSFGNILMGITDLKQYSKWLLYDPFDEECCGCKMIPVCVGGCPHSQIYNSRKKCRSLKYNYESILNILHEQQE